MLFFNRMNTTLLSIITGIPEAITETCKDLRSFFVNRFDNIVQKDNGLSSYMEIDLHKKEPSTT